MISLTAEGTLNLNHVAICAEPVEIYTTDGTYLGLFVPALLDRSKRMEAEVAAKVDWVEVDRRTKMPEGAVPLADIVARMKAWDESGAAIPENLSPVDAAGLLKTPAPAARHNIAKEKV
jgi:hypothetical protein